jgi:hypothetical protein
MPVSAIRDALVGIPVYSFSRWGFDVVSGYKYKPIPPGSSMSLEELRKGKYVLSERQWLTVRLQSIL